MDERIGSGGMGEVWRATDEALGRVVAVKCIQSALLDDADSVMRFEAEARAMATIKHPGVVTVYDFQADTSSAFMVMEYIEGEALSHTLRHAGRLTPEYTMDLIAQAAEALHAAHERGIIHRDVKPANLLIREDGAVVLTDFGIARVSHGARLTAAGQTLGTPSYFSPEQALGQPVTPRSDVYSLGVVAYECLTGQRPFDRDNPIATATARVREAPPTLPRSIPPRVCEVLEQALATEPTDRWRSAADLAAACRRARTHATASLPLQR